jgi:hypothetical protein
VAPTSTPGPGRACPVAWAEDVDPRRELPGSAHRLALQPYSIELPPHRNAMAGGVIKDQVKFRRQLNGSGHEQPNARRREVPYAACDEGDLLKRDHACLEAAVTRGRSPFNASVHGNPAQGCPPRFRSDPVLDLSFAVQSLDASRP